MANSDARRDKPRNGRRWRLSVSIAVLSVLLDNAALAGPIEDATAAMRNRDWKTAVALFRPLAERGNPIAQRNLGFLFNQSFAPDIRDVGQSLLWYGKAAEQGDALSEEALGRVYISGRDVPADSARGLALMAISVSHGNANAAHQLGQMYRIGTGGLPEDEEKSVAWSRLAAELGVANDQANLGIALQNGGPGVGKDLIEANFWYRRAGEALLAKAESGDATSQFSLGVGYEVGMVGFPADQRLALAWYRKSLRGDPKADLHAKLGIASIERAMPLVSDEKH